MNTKKILHLLIILSIFSILSVITANYTYKDLKQRVQTIFTLEPDFFSLEDIPFNFRQELVTAASGVRVGELNIKDKNVAINCEKIPKKNGYRSISVDSEFDQFIIEIIGQKIKDNENCINDILEIVTKKFHDNVKKKIDIIKSNKIYLLEILNKSNRPNINEDNFNLISVSELVNLIKLDKIKNAILGKSYSISTDKQDIEHLTYINEGVKKILTNYLIDNQINFSIVSPIDSINENYKIEIQNTLLSDSLEIKRLESLLKNNPFEIYSADSMYVKISKRNYIFSLLMLVNIIGLSIFIILNRSYFKKLIKKIS